MTLISCVCDGEPLLLINRKASRNHSEVQTSAGRGFFFSLSCHKDNGESADKNRGQSHISLTDFKDAAVLSALFWRMERYHFELLRTTLHVLFFILSHIQCWQASVALNLGCLWSWQLKNYWPLIQHFTFIKFTSPPLPSGLLGK